MIRNLNVQSADSASNTEVLLSIFPTEIGWMGILGRDQIVVAAVIGHPSATSVLKAVKRSINTIESIGAISFREQDWFPDLRHRLQIYAKGQQVEFGEFQLRLPRQTKFRNKVMATTRSLRYGQTTTYGDLAKRVGHPGAARAVGTVMATNRFPILIPCHRVLAAGGKLGGYTSPTGTKLKQKLLDLEQRAWSRGPV